MNTGTKTIGQAALESWQFIRSIQRDAFAVTQAVDALMSKHGWYATEASKISEDLSNRSLPDRWILRSISRIYTNDVKAVDATNAMAIQVLFDPPEMYDEPVCLGFTSSYGSAMSANDLWNNWSNEGSMRVLEHLSKNSEPSEIPEGILKQLVPSARRGKAFVVPLCVLESESIVSERVVTPLLAAVKELK